MRGRGSKRAFGQAAGFNFGRLPCGGVDRNTSMATGIGRSFAASHAGAWIETGRLGSGRVCNCAASHAGAWIETRCHLCRKKTPACRLPCGGVDRNFDIDLVCVKGFGRLPCGGVDRNAHHASLDIGLVAASHAGAWIETRPTRCARQRLRPPPMRGRGSKHVGPGQRARRLRRLPCGGVDRNQQPIAVIASSAGRLPCGGVDRNLFQGVEIQNPVAASHAGAWIETFQWDTQPMPNDRRLPCGGVDRNLPRPDRQLSPAGRLPCGGVDRNNATTLSAGTANCRLPCGGVDRNWPLVNVMVAALCRLPCGGVDRNNSITPTGANPFAASHAGAWIETI